MRDDMPKTVARRNDKPFSRASTASSARTLVTPYNEIGRSGVSSVQCLPDSPIPYPLFVVGKMMRCDGAAMRHSICTASRLTVLAAIGS